MKMKVKMYDINKKKEWEYYYSKLKDEIKDIQYKFEYFENYSKIEDGEALLIIYETEDGLVYYPFFKRLIKDTKYYDITSQYGYGGPLNNFQKNLEMNLSKFYKEFKNFCIKENIISEFIRFHPMIKNYNGLEKIVDCIKISEVVYIDLTLEEEEIFKKYKYNNRKSINKSKKLGVSSKIHQNIDSFYDIYLETMKRNNALEYYYYELDFFKYFKENLSNNSFYMFAQNDSSDISTELVIYSKEYAHSFLGGTFSEFFNLCPNNALKHSIVQELKKKGVKYFILGGGYTKNDGIFKYKKSFNEDGILDFYIGKKIHNKSIYQNLVNEFDLNYPEKKDINTNFFPLYRR